MNGHSDAIDNEDFPFSEETTNLLIKHGYTNEEFEHPYIDERKEELAGFGEFTNGTTKAPTQNEEVWAWLEQHGTITDNEARDYLYINRLAARVYDLKQDGYPIESEMITVKRPNRRSVSFAKYFIKSDED